MLYKVCLEKNQIVLKFDLKNAGKYRLKKLAEDKITSTYSEIVCKEDINNGSWYLEWQISYYITKSDLEKKKSEIPKNLYIEGEDKLVKLSNKKEAYPFELPVLFYHAINCSLLPKTSMKYLIEWVESIKDDEFLDSLLKPTIRKHCKNITIKDMRFIPAQVKLPFMVYENSDETWVEIIWQKQQYAYSFQPMVYFCIPYTAFRENHAWIINSENAETFINLLKIFALTSKAHCSDILQILKSLPLA